MKAEMEVLHPGLYTSIQDLGRIGFMEYGVPISGAMDSVALNMANLLLENSEKSAVLEITQLGPKLAFSAETRIALTGADLSPAVNGESVENNKALKVHAGDVLSFGKRVNGCRAYLGIKGGFRTETVLGSKSWYEGLTEFVKLEKGMKIPYEASTEIDSENYSGIKAGSYISSKLVEVFKGPEFEKLSDKEVKRLFQTEFSIDRNNNRMGIQLQEMIENTLSPILTGPVLPGTVQLTPSGKLIILMRDGQTTGGYPRILQLSERGINTLAQKVMKEKVKFKLI